MRAAARITTTDNNFGILRAPRDSRILLGARVKTPDTRRLHNTDLDLDLHMGHALALAGRVLTTTPNPRVGCVIVGQDNTVLGQGWHQTPGQAHAEVLALAQAGDTARGATVFVTLEPCAHHGKTPPCAEALVRAGVRRVIIAGVDPFPAVAGKGIERLEKAGIEVFLLDSWKQRARLLNPGYFKRMETGLPRVRCKLAMSLDGRTAAADGHSQWITGPPARSDVQRLRAASCAIVTGINTVLRDDPAMNVRAAELNLDARERQDNAFALGRQPLRFILDSRLRTPATAKILKAPGPAVILHTIPAGTAAAVGDPERIQLPAGETGVDGRAVLELLASRFQANEVLLEAGPTLAGAWLGAGLVDELVVYVGACLLGQEGMPLMHLQSILSMTDKIPLEITDLTRVGADIKITARIGTS